MDPAWLCKLGIASVSLFLRRRFLPPASERENSSLCVWGQLHFVLRRVRLSWRPWGAVVVFSVLLFVFVIWFSLFLYSLSLYPSLSLYSFFPLPHPLPLPPSIPLPLLSLSLLLFFSRSLCYYLFTLFFLSLSVSITSYKGIFTKWVVFHHNPRSINRVHEPLQKFQLSFKSHSSILEIRLWLLVLRRSLDNMVSTERLQRSCTRRSEVVAKGLQRSSEDHKSQGKRRRRGDKSRAGMT